MIKARALLVLLPLLPLLAAKGADSAELAPAARLVPGGGATWSDSFAPSAPWGESRQPLLSLGKVSAGALTGSAPLTAGQGLALGGAGTPLAVGGYVALGGGTSQLSSSLRSNGITSGADLAASWSGGLLGPRNLASLSLGISQTDWSRISPNSQYSGLLPNDAGGGRADLNMSLSLTHQVSPSFSVGGMAGANRSSGTEGKESGLTLGAGLGLRF
jgi:hypothetical protein